MRIAIDVRWLCRPYLNGYSRYVSNLIRHLQRIHDCDLVLLADDRASLDPLFAVDLPMPVVRLPARRELLREQAVLPRMLRDHQIDVYHAPADEGVPVLCPCKRVLTCHGVPHHVYFEYMLRHRHLTGDLSDYLGDVLPRSGVSLKSSYRAVRTAVMQRAWRAAAERIIAVSEHVKWELTTLLGVPSSKVVVVHEAPDEGFGRQEAGGDAVGQVRERYGIKGDYLISVSSLARLKNTAGALALCRDLRRRGRESMLVLVGAVWHDDYRSLARQYGLIEGRDVMFLQGIPDEDLKALYRGAVLFVLLSWYEAFSFPLAEAMASGLPIVVSSFGALPEVLGDGGLVVDPRNQSAVVETIARVLDDPELRRQLRQRARSRAEAFTWQSTARETFDVYAGVLGRPAHAALTS